MRRSPPARNHMGVTSYVPALATTMSMVLVIAVSGTSAAENVSDGEPAAAPPAVEVVARGAFVGGAGAARVDGRRGLVHSSLSYDGAHERRVVEGTAEITLGDRFLVRAGGSLDTHDVRPIISAQLDALRQERHGIDLAVATGYEQAGFNTVPGVFGGVGVARAVGRTRLGASARFGLGLEEGERHGELRAGALARVTHRLFAGAEARFGIDLERDTDEPEAEPDWQVAGGPVAAYAIGRLVLTGQAGAAATRYRLVPGTRIGVMAMLGAGTVF